MSKIIGVDTNPEKQEKGMHLIRCQVVHSAMSPLRVNYFVPGTGKLFGVTDFINPDELSEPVQQVFYSTQLVTCSSLSFGISCNSFLITGIMRFCLTATLINC